MTKRRQKTVFLSYRRADFPWAIAIYQSLVHRGFNVFIDYEGLGSGEFGPAILENIAARAHFLLVLTPKALDRIDAPGDWLRREIEAAIACERNIVPLMLDGFDFGTASVTKRLTGRLARLPQYSGLMIVRSYFGAGIERLERQFLSLPVATRSVPASAKASDVARHQQRAAESGYEATGSDRPSAGLPQSSSAADLPTSLVWPAQVVVRRAGARLEFELSGPTPEAECSGSVAYQPEMLEPFLRDFTQIGTSAEDQHAIFQTVVPPEVRAALRRVTHLLLEVDADTGSLPWEALRPEPARGGINGLPLGVQAGVVRLPGGLVKKRPRLPPVPDRALVIADPSTNGFGEAFPQSGPADLPRLAGAAAEGLAVAGLLRSSGFDVREAGAGADSRKVLAALHAGPWRVLHVAGHGVLDAAHRDGTRRSGIVLSDGAILTAAQIAALEVPPELIVFTCEHFGSLRRRSGGGNESEQSWVATLLGAGVRCIVAPVGHVDDQAAKLFSEVLFDRLLHDGADFGIAVWAARRALWERSSADFTLATLHAYGDPAWHARRG